VIPEVLQDRIIKLAHKSHQGIAKTKALLRSTVWFPKLDTCVERAVKNCLPCQAATHKPTNALNPLQMTELPKRAWDTVNIDFCGPFPDRKDYLLVVIDQFSRFPEVEVISSVSFESVVPKLDDIFSRQGIPATVITDNDAPFNGKDLVSSLST
jgi:transposase InsO family protein